MKRRPTTSDYMRAAYDHGQRLDKAEKRLRKAIHAMLRVTERFNAVTEEFRAAYADVQQLKKGPVLFR